jgi:hypothetical protein
MFDGTFPTEYGQFLSMMFGWAGVCIVLVWLLGPVLRFARTAWKAEAEPTVDDTVGEDPKVYDNARKLPGIFVGVKGVHD